MTVQAYGYVGGDHGLYGTRAERLALTGGSLPGGMVLFTETDSGNVYEHLGSGLWNQVGTNGAAHVIADAGLGFGIAQNRRDSGLTTTRRTMTWPTGEGPTKINIRYQSGTSPQKVYVVINAISDTHADSELADPPSQDATTERYTIFATSVDPAGRDIASFDSIDRIDYLLAAADASSILNVEGA